MHDIRAIRDDPDAFDAALARRGDAGASFELVALDRTRREAIAGAEAALADRNAASKEVGAAKAAGNEAEFDRLRVLVAQKKEEIARLDEGREGGRDRPARPAARTSERAGCGRAGRRR